MPTLKRWAAAASVGILAMSRMICLFAGLGVEDVLGVEVEGGQGGHRRDQHPHRVGVVVEALEEALAYVLVDEGVVA